MKFREHGSLETFILEAKSAWSLVTLIEAKSDEYDFIDLQYSTTTLQDGSVHYSALVLANKKGDKQ